MEEEDGERLVGGPGAAVGPGHAVRRAEGQSGSEGEGNHHPAGPVRHRMTYDRRRSNTNKGLS